MVVVVVVVVVMVVVLGWRKATELYNFNCYKLITVFTASKVSLVGDF